MTSQNEIQEVWIEADADQTGLEGWYRLSFDGEETANIEHDASSAVIKSRLEELTTVDEVEVSGTALTSESPIVVEFVGTHAGEPQPLIVISHHTELNHASEEVIRVQSGMSWEHHDEGFHIVGVETVWHNPRFYGRSLYTAQLFYSNPHILSPEYEGVGVLSFDEGQWSTFDTHGEGYHISSETEEEEVIFYAPTFAGQGGVESLLLLVYPLEVEFVGAGTFSGDYVLVYPLEGSFSGAGTMEVSYDVFEPVPHHGEGYHIASEPEEEPEGVFQPVVTLDAEATLTWENKAALHPATSLDATAVVAWNNPVIHPAVTLTASATVAYDNPVSYQPSVSLDAVALVDYELPGTTDQPEVSLSAVADVDVSLTPQQPGVSLSATATAEFDNPVTYHPETTLLGAASVSVTQTVLQPHVSLDATATLDYTQTRLQPDVSLLAVALASFDTGEPVSPAIRVDVIGIEVFRELAGVGVSGRSPGQTARLERTVGEVTVAEREIDGPGV